MAELPDELRRRVVKVVDPTLFPDIPDLDKEDFPFWGFGLVFQPSLSYLYGYNPTKRGFVALRVTEGGQLLVSGMSPATEALAKKESVTDAGVVVDLGGEYNVHLIINDGPNSVYIAFNRAATTSDFELKSGEYLEIPILAEKIGLICNATETATVRILSRR
ncbi:MAG: hypothetical protein J7J51_05255 [Candidatus Omnitrophica bacterium]|nr:hypothetical protein [Candidatus Omnitrophota bacterium]